tara:strand:+ start:1300 stop:1854 length:555 start_codon:yes stop_codon:yes gene_type:complete
MNNYIVINNNTKLVSNIELATTLPSSSSNEIILNQNDYSDIVGINDLYVSESNTFEKTLIGNFNFEQNDTFPPSGDAPTIDISNYIFSESLFEFKYSYDVTEISSSYFSITNGEVINFTQDSKGCSFNIDPDDTTKNYTGETNIWISYNSLPVKDEHGRIVRFYQDDTAVTNLYEFIYTGSIWS